MVFGTKKVFYGSYRPKLFGKYMELAIGRGYKYEILAPEILNLNLNFR